jgi:hypothetical protein
VQQQGVSRVWFDDRGWFTTIVEFQPSSYARGAYLNIGANPHWYKETNIGFSLILDYRTHDFVKYYNDEQFTIEMEKFCELAIREILEFREKLTLIHSAKEFILNYNYVECAEIWRNYYKGTICGIADDFDGLNKYYNEVLKESSTKQWTDGNAGKVHIAYIQWIEDLKENVKYLLSKTSNLKMFKEEILKIIYETRKLKKLPAIEINLLE